jgi:RNA polymerase sigma factor (sigma-70 family)
MGQIFRLVVFTTGRPNMPDHHQPAADRLTQPAYGQMRRVVIEERQQKKLEHVRASAGYAEDVSPHAHDGRTFRLINQRKELDKLPEADYVVPILDEWKHWTKMSDWDSRNGLLEQLVAKLRCREATPGEIQVLVVICRPTWAKVARSLRRYGGIQLDEAADGAHRREESRRVNELDRDELDQVIQHALLDALVRCPRPFPRRFFAWLQTMLVHRALDHVRQDLTEHDAALPLDGGIREVVEAVLADDRSEAAAAFRTPASPDHAQWLRTLDLPAIFDLSHEYATYARTRTACERAVERLPNRQRQVVQAYYFDAMTQTELAARHGLVDSTIRNTHTGALRNLRRDDELFDVLEAIGKVRDYARRLALEAERRAA